MDKLAAYIFEARHNFLETFIPIFKARYAHISNNKENVTIAYKSDLKETNLKDLLEASINKDKSLQYTSKGVHKDDLVFKLGDTQLRNLEVKDNKNHF